MVTILSSPPSDSRFYLHRFVCAQQLCFIIFSRLLVVNVEPSHLDLSLSLSHSVSAIVVPVSVGRNTVPVISPQFVSKPSRCSHKGFHWIQYSFLYICQFMLSAWTDIVVLSLIDPGSGKEAASYSFYSYSCSWSGMDHTSDSISSLNVTVRRYNIRPEEVFLRANSMATF